MTPGETSGGFRDDSRDTAQASPRVTDLDGTRRVGLIVHWPTPDSPAHCLARVFIPPPPRPSVAIVSEIRSNSDELAFGEDFPLVADAVIDQLMRVTTANPRELVWITHHGDFSSYDGWGAPEAFMQVTLDWDGRHYHGDLTRYRRITLGDLSGLLGGAGVEPVPQALSDLGQPY